MSANLGFKEVNPPSRMRDQHRYRGRADWVNVAGYRIERRSPLGSGTRGGSWMYSAYAPDGRFLGMSGAMAIATEFAMTDYLVIR